MRHTRYSGLNWLTAGLAGLLIAGCAAHENQALEQARATYAQAQSRPEVVTNAPLVLREAEETLRQAEQADDEEETTHLAYLAGRKSEIAIAVAEREEAQKEAGRLESQKQELLLKARESEAERARRLAEARAEKLEEARKTAEERAREAEQARREMEQLQSELSELKARPTERGIVLTLGDVLFEFNKAELLPGAQRSVDKLAAFLREHPDRQVRIEGHTDSVGSDEYNQRLSERRAEAVSQGLQSRGVPAERMVTAGYGEQYPVAGNDSPGGRQQNRRVEVVILNPGEEAGQKGREAPAQ